MEKTTPKQCPPSQQIHVTRCTPDYVTDTVGFTSLAVFKRCIRTVDFSEFLMCNDVEFSYLEKVKSESESE